MADASSANDLALIKEALEGITQSLLVIDDALNILYANSGFIALFSLPPELVERGRPVEDLHRYLALRGEYGPGDPEAHVAFRQRPLHERSSYRLDRKRACGTYIEIAGSPLPSGGYVFTFTDVTERRLAQQHLEQQVANRTESLSAANLELSRLADLDPLLGIFNRRKFYQLATLARQRRASDDVPLSLLMVDVDHFKSINDRYGHSAGDMALKTVAAALVAGLRQDDVVARYGGEEFVVLLPNGRLANARAVAEKLRRRVAATTIVLGSLSLHVTVSIGLAVWSDPSQPLDSVLGDADEALYHAKQSGRDCVFVAPSAEGLFLPEDRLS
ncbi:sensor domain-containing diguanylate cyclase [Chitinimonas lacunae]|uniref:diguanylate cyclase n=1 Tax=Chitinimonas lacunae TaxID=1963018 RepID=A0ABV8MLI2_9NEIS